MPISTLIGFVAISEELMAKSAFYKSKTGVDIFCSIESKFTGPDIQTRPFSTVGIARGFSLC